MSTGVYHKKAQRKRRVSPFLPALALIAAVIIAAMAFNNRSKPIFQAYDINSPEIGITPLTNSILADSFASDLCVVDKNKMNNRVRMNEAKSAYLFSTSDLKTLYSKNVFKRVYPASLTKVMTALVVLENCNIKDKVTVSKEINSLPGDSSMANIKAGDKLTVEQLLYGLMLPSGGDAAVALAVHTAGNVNDFCKLMNEEAVKLGATKTHFMNPHGLHDKKHYTTPYDMYLIFNEAVKNEDFVRIISTPKYICNYTNAEGKSAQLTFTNTNRYLTAGEKTPDNVMMIGGKTGFTSAAGKCLIVLTKDENSSYISAVFKSKDDYTLYRQMTDLFKEIS